jgi:DNA replication initiation complex subunit (GINS family)
MITFNDIYEAARKERYSEQLQKLNKNFIPDVANYLKEKKEIASKEDDVFSDVIIKTKKQLENAIILFKELMLRRRKKILNLILIAAEIGISKQDFDNMFTLEKELFEELMKCISAADKKLSNSFNGEKEEKLQKNELIVFKENVEEFVDLGGEKMGPFEKGQIANIPNEIAKILIDGNKAEVIEK